MTPPFEISNTIGVKYDGKTIPDGERKLLVINDKEIILEKPLFDSQFTFKEDSLSRLGFVKISYDDRFCVTYNSSLPTHFYYLKKRNR